VVPLDRCGLPTLAAAESAGSLEHGSRARTKSASASAATSTTVSRNELVSLIIGLSTAEEDRDTPPALAARLSGLRERAQTTLTEIREIARGDGPLLLTAAGALQNVAKHAPNSQATLRLRHRGRMLAVRIEDNGDGFVRERGRGGSGLRNIRDRSPRSRRE